VQAPVAEQNLRQAQTNLDNARATLKRNEDLFKKNFISASAVDDSRKAVELMDAQLRSSQKQLETTRLSGSDYAMAQTAVAQARASADVAHARAGYTRIIAPVDRILIDRNVEVGDVVQPGKVLITLSPQGKPQLWWRLTKKT
jgi:HlyD family secretion protein